MTDFLEITLTKSLEFRCDFKSDIYGIHGESTFYPSIRQSGIKIDTGAHGILIPLRTLCWTVSEDAPELTEKELSEFRQANTEC